jgi:hypothetical protein
MKCCWAAVPGVSKNHIAFNFRVMQPTKWSFVRSGCTYLQTRTLVWVKELWWCLVSGVGTRCTGCWFGGEVKLHLGFSWPYQFLVWRDTLQ